MKYGDTLRQRSIPEWGHYNIDYDYLKDLIKHHTTPGAGTAVSIPGQGSTTEIAFGETFFKVLKAQHDRINLFIKSKSGEIDRRLNYIGKQLAHVQAHTPSTGPGPLPARTVEKLARIENDALLAGEEIRSLSRFRIAQRTGFHKILKKYKRWTKDRAFERRFKEEVSSSPDSFFQLDLGYLLDQYIDILGALRAAVEHSGPSSQHADPNKPSSASKLHAAVEESSEIDFDVALTTVPLGPHGSRATYWIHPDHVVEVEVLLLQHMRLFFGRHAVSASPERSPELTPSGSRSSTLVSNHLRHEDYVGLVIMDDPASFAQKQNASTISASEDEPGALPTKAVSIARWTSSGSAAVVSGLECNQRAEKEQNVKITKVKQKYLAPLLKASDERRPQSANQGDGVAQSQVSIEEWLTDHRTVRPIASICSRRTRFVGLHSSAVGGCWASLDRDIILRKSLPEDLCRDGSFTEVATDASSFPHAVLELRREGAQSASLIRLLDRSHLVERVRGFSLETHAVWSTTRPSNMSPPTWISLLDQDIRKLPTPVRRQRRNAPSATDSTSHLSPHQTSTSATSPSSPYRSQTGDADTSATDFIEPPPLRAFRKKKRHHSGYDQPVQVETPTRQRYWNEYDNPESEDEGYYIYLDPNASTKLPGQELMENWLRKTKSLFRRGKLEQSTPLSATSDAGSSDSETADESTAAFRGNYGTMPPGARRPSHQGYFGNWFRHWYDHDDVFDSMRQQSIRERQSLISEINIQQHQREIATFQLYASCLGAAAVLDIILGTLLTTSRRRLRGEVDRAIVFGVCCNLVLLLVAVTSMLSRREKLSWLHRGVVCTVAVAMVVGDALLLLRAVSS